MSGGTSGRPERDAGSSGRLERGGSASGRLERGGGACSRLKRVGCAGGRLDMIGGAGGRRKRGGCGGSSLERRGVAGGSLQRDGGADGRLPRGGGSGGRLRRGGGGKKRGSALLLSFRFEPERQFRAKDRAQGARHMHNQISQPLVSCDDSCHQTELRTPKCHSTLKRTSEDAPSINFMTARPPNYYLLSVFRIMSGQ